MIINPYSFGGGPGSPQVVGSSSNANIAVTSHTIDLPATINIGDLILVMTLRNSTAAITPPAGYSSLASATASGSGSAYQLFYKTADGSEGGTTLTFTTSATRTTVLICYVVQVGTWQGTPEQATYNGDTGMSADPPSLTPSWGSAANLWIAAYGGRQNASVSSWPLPANQITRTSGSSGTGGRSMSVCSDVVSAETLDPSPFILNNAENGSKIAITTAIRPA